MRHITSSSLQYVLKISSSSTNTSTFASSMYNCVNQSSPLAVDASFQFFDLRFQNEDKVRDFQCFCGLSNFLSRRMHYPVWIHCCRGPNYDFCIS